MLSQLTLRLWTSDIIPSVGWGKGEQRRAGGGMRTRGAAFLVVSLVLALDIFFVIGDGSGFGFVTGEQEGPRFVVSLFQVSILVLV